MSGIRRELPPLESGESTGIVTYRSMGHTWTGPAQRMRSAVRGVWNVYVWDEEYQAWLNASPALAATYEAKEIAP